MVNRSTHLALGKVPPQATEFEAVIIGALLLDQSAFHRISTFITAETFYMEHHKLIFAAIAKMHALSRNVDMMTVGAFMKSEGTLDLAGGNYGIAMLTDRVSNSANLEDHALIIQQHYLKRELIRISSEAISSAYDDTSDVFDLYELVSSNMFKNISVNSAKQAQIIGDVMAERMKEYAMPAPENGLTGVGSGYPSIDRVTGGWQNGDLVIIAARPAMGKTAFVMNLARNAATIHREKVLVFSLEMSTVQLVDRMVSAETEIYLEHLRKKGLRDWELHKISSATQLITASIHIDDQAAMPIQVMRSKATRMKELYGITLIVVDYLQLAKGDKAGKGNREQEISQISQGLKAIAKDLDVPVLALSQLSRAVESRPGALGKRPQLSDLRESGSIEQDADQVIFLYRPEYYGITEDETGRSLAGMTEIIWAKNRHGPLNIVPMKFNGGFMKFSEIDETNDPVDVQTLLPLQPNENFDRPSGNIIIKPSRLDDLEDQDVPF